jgi:predicted DNA-binding transcriptional regulator YafY
MALFLGARLLLRQAAGGLTAGAEQALAKLAVALPEATRRRVEALTGIIEFITPQARFNLEEPQLISLQQAIQNQQVVHLHYYSYNQNEMTERDVEPHQLFYSDGAWYVSGYCQLRQEMRSFRLSRIEELALRADTFVKQTPPEPEVGWVTVRIRFAADIARWVRERQHYAFQAEETSPDPQGVVMVYRLNSLAEITPWLLSWGAAAEVLAPPELREKIRQEAARLADMLT